MGDRRTLLGFVLGAVFSQRDDDLDLDRTTPRKRGYSDRRARVAPGVAEHVVQDAARPVHDGRLFVEIRGRRHVPGHGEHPFDAIERAQRRLEHGKCVQSAHRCSGPAFFHGDRIAESSDTGEPALDPGELARRPCDPFVDDHGVERIVRGMGAVEHEPERFDSRPDVPCHRAHRTSFEDAAGDTDGVTGTPADCGELATIDLNADVGEVDDPAQLELALLECVTSANIATGAHAGNPAVMDAAVTAARRLGVRVGAHPSYPDRAGFGRRVISMSHEALLVELIAQVRALDAIARAHGDRVHHLKPHGALYHRAATDEECAKVVAEVAGHFPGMALVAPAGAPLLDGRRGGSRTVAEAFADRGYRPDGSLVPRGETGDLLTDPEHAAEQAVSIATSHRVRSTDGTWIEMTAETLCLHGDTPGASLIAASVRTALEDAGVVVVATP